VKLVVNTSVLFAALLKKSTIRKLLLNPFFEFYVPEFCIEEIERHVEETADRSGVGAENVYLLLAVFLVSVQVVPAEKLLKRYKEAERIIGKIDTDDVPFIALALSFPNDGIWSEDKHFLRQKKVRVWRTRDLLKFLKE